MSRRPMTVVPAYRPIKTSELKPVAEVYHAMLSQPGVLALFTAEDAGVDAGWVVDFENAISAVENIVASRVMMKVNKDLTKGIKDNSKKSVKYGRKLRYYLKRAFAGQPGLMASFPIVRANNMMRLGDSEAFVYEVKTIIQQIAANQGALTAVGWPVQNLTDYQTLHSTVEGLNVAQEEAKQLVPENTDAAIRTRNVCYGFIQTLLRLKDVVYDGDKLKQSEWMVKSILKGMRNN